MNNKTGYLEKSRTNVLFHRHNKKFKRIEKIFDHKTLVAKRTSYCVYTCLRTEIKKRQIDFYDLKGYIYKTIEYQYLNTNIDSISYKITLFDPLQYDMTGVDTLALDSISINKIEKEFLYIK